MAAVREAGGGGERAYHLMGTEFPFCKMTDLGDGCGDGRTAMWMYLIPLNCTLKNG